MDRRQLQIVKPCTRDWADMKGTSAMRHCTSCEKSVYNVSMLTEREADAAFASRPAEVCVIYYVDADGDVVFYPEADPSRRRSPRHRLVAALAASALAACSQPTAAEKEAPPVAIVNSAVQSSVLPIAATPAASFKTSPVVAAVPDTSAAEETKAEDCDPSWNEAFKDAGRSDAHLRNTRPKPGGLRRHHGEDEGDPLNPYRK
jgi:hypothetical protein